MDTICYTQSVMPKDKGIQYGDKIYFPNIFNGLFLEDIFMNKKEQIRLLQQGLAYGTASEAIECSRKILKMFNEAIEEDI